MTEEMIIDGVNVWNCKHYDLENNYCDQSYLGEGGLLKNTKNPKRCEGSPNCYFKQLKRLQETLKHTENGRKAKANKLKRIEEIVTHCIQGGFTDEFVQEIFDICREYEEV